MSKLTAEQREEWKDRARRWLDMIRKRVDGNYPDFLVAQAVVCLFRLAMGYFPEDVGMEFTSIMAGDARRYVGLCHSCKCSNNVAPRRTHLPYCEKCEAEFLGDVFRFEMESDEEKGAQS